jgi:hypothetical protein
MISITCPCFAFTAALKLMFAVHSFQETELRRSPFFSPLVLSAAPGFRFAFSSVAFAVG